MEHLDLGSIVSAPLTIGRHFAIVLSTKAEIEETGKVHVVAISKNTTISRPEDLIEVPHRYLGLKKGSFVQCGVTELLPAADVAPKHKKAFGPFLLSVVKQVKTAAERGRQSTQS